MYWIYFIIFTLIVFVPSVVQQGLLGLSDIQTQEYVILLLGIIAFILFFHREKLIKKNVNERLAMRSQLNQMTKDLTNSYSYIGEINRKLDILTHIPLEFPKSSDITVKKQRELYDSITDAIELFGKSDEFVLRFISGVSEKILKEIKSSPNVSITFPPEYDNPSEHYFENDQLIIATSPTAINNVQAFIILKKKKFQQKIDDPRILNTLAMQALSVFVFMNQKTINYQRKSLKSIQHAV